MTAMRATGTLLWLTVLWVALWGNLSVANVASGLAIAAIVLVLARLPRLADRNDADRSRVSILPAIRFGVVVLVKLVQANMLLAWEIVTPRNRINAGVVAVPLRTESSLVMLIVSNVITLTPGSFTLEVRGTPPVLYVNVLHLHDLEDVRRELLHIEELSVRAFGSPLARAQLAAGSVA
jgi:multicomponent Na+:H+ antiporter subunit E